MIKYPCGKLQGYCSVKHCTYVIMDRGEMTTLQRVFLISSGQGRCPSDVVPCAAEVGKPPATVMNYLKDSGCTAVLTAADQVSPRWNPDVCWSGTRLVHYDQGQACSWQNAASFAGWLKDNPDEHPVIMADQASLHSLVVDALGIKPAFGGRFALDDRRITVLQFANGRFFLETLNFAPGGSSCE